MLLYNSGVVSAALLAVTVLTQSAQAQKADDPKKFVERANGIYSEHKDCAVALGVTAGYIIHAQPTRVTQYNEALTQYMNRFLGVAHVIGRTSDEVSGQVRTDVRAINARLAADPDKAKARKSLSSYVERSTLCLRSIGYSASTSAK